MCGIVGYVGDRQAQEVLIEGLSRLEYRGYDSAGVCIADAGGRMRIKKSKGRLAVVADMLKASPIPGNTGIGHTRWATHGEPSDENSHPHKSRRVAIVHNGIIENHRALREKLVKKGYGFLSQTDTEVAAHLIDYYYSGDPLEALTKAANALEGSFALAVMFDSKPGEIYAVRSQSPLVIGLGEGENFIASDIPAVLKYTREYLLPASGQIAKVTKDSVEVFGFDGESAEAQKIHVDWDTEAAEKGGFDHFMLKEISEEPRALGDTLGPRVTGGKVRHEIFKLTDREIRGLRKIHIVACGTAMHAGMIGKKLIEAWSRVPTDVDIASEYRYRNPILSADDLVILISQSGETADTLAALRLAKSRGAYTLAVVNVVGSSIAREADDVLYTYAGPEIAVASTKAYSVQLLAMVMVALRIADAKKTLPPEEIAGTINSLQTLPELVREQTQRSGEIKEIAKGLEKTRNMFYIGRGMDYALALEGALKIKEISYIHSEAYAAGELKHGTISLIEQGSPVVAIATVSDILDKTAANIREVASRGAKVTLICREKDVGRFDPCDSVITLPDVPDLLIPIVAITPLQLLAYHAAVLRGCDVDKPRNLAKSVTVE
ncbi:MAG: glutamine--fructose-6-phosphate transaminase (isomerizing) [Clostridia bacterium]|nr:glutamine--fructose-6-phosphate transaminase (isomerizing) [Clostridia bacterium]